MNDNKLKFTLKNLRESCLTSSTHQYIRLYLDDEAFYTPEFIKSALDEIELLEVTLMMNGVKEASPLQQIAIQVLKTSSQIDFE